MKSNMKIYFVVILSIFLISTISSYDFDNTKSYDQATKTVTIKNCAIWTGVCLVEGNKYADMQLTSSLNERVIKGKDVKVAEFIISNFQKDYAEAFDKIEIYDLKRASEKITDRTFIYKYYTKTGTIDRPIYTNECKELFSEINKTNYQDCTRKQIGTSKDNVYGWISFKELNELPDGNIKVGIFTEVKADDYVEWIPTFFGVKIDEWAVWTESFNDNLLAYWNLDETTGTNYGENVNGVNNGTITGSGGVSVQGKNNNGFYSGGSAYVHIENLPQVTQNFTVSMWLNMTTGDSDHKVLSIGSNKLDIAINNNVANKIELNVWDEGSNYFPLTDVLGLTYYAWDHYVFVGNGTDIAIWKNGILDNLLNYSGTIKVSTNNSNIFASAGGTRIMLDGSVDEVAYWNRSMSAAEIATLYDSGSGTFYSSSGGDIFNISLITLTQPQDALYTSNSSFIFNSTFSVENGNFTNATLIVWNSSLDVYKINSTIKTGIVNDSSLSLSDLVIGNYEWNYLICANNVTDTQCKFATSNYSLTVGINYIQATSSQIAFEGRVVLFNLTLSTATATSSATAQLYWNNTLYIPTKTIISSNTTFFNYNLTIPSNTGTISGNNISWYWQYSIPTIATGNTTFNNQTIYSIIFQYCNSTYNSSFVNFTIRDELTMYELNGSFAATFDLLDNNNNIIDSYSYSNNSNLLSHFDFCAYPSDSIVRLNMQSEYTSPSYVDRTYYFTRATLTNSSSLIDLLLLNSSLSTKFFILAKQSTTPLSNANIIVTKYNVANGTYSAISTRLTDDSGEFIEYLDLDKNYKFLIYKDGTFLEAISKTATCSATPCEMTLELSTAYVDVWSKYYDIYATNVVYNLSYDPLSKIVTLDAADLTGLAEYFNLRVDKLSYTNQSENIVCNQTLFSPAGTLTCNMTNYEGNFKASAYISRSPALLIDSLTFIIQSIKDVLKNEGLLFLLIGIITVGLAGAWNPVVGIILACVMLYMGVAMGIVAMSLTSVVLIIILGIFLITKMGRNV